MFLSVFLSVYLSLVDTAKVVTEVIDGFFCDLLQRVVDMFHTVAMDFMTNFEPDMEQYLKMFGYAGSDFSAFAWTQTSEDTIVNLCGIFATMGYIFAIGILVISLLKASMPNVVESREAPMALLVRFVGVFLLITYSNSVVGLMFKVTQKLWDILYDADKLATIDATTGNIGSIDIMKLPGLLALIFSIMIIVELFKVLLELIDKFLLAGFLFLCFPLAAGLAVSRDTVNVFKAYVRMLISELFLMLMNVWFISMLNVLVLNIGNNEIGLDAIVQCVVVIAFEKLAQNLDIHMRKLGLNTAVTGGNLLDALMMSANRIMAAPGRLARSVRAGQDAANILPNLAAQAFVNNGNYSGAMAAAGMTPGIGARMDAQESIKEAALRDSKGLSPEQIKATGVQGAILNSGGGANATSAANAIKLGGGESISSALAEGFDVTGGTNGVKLGDSALWNDNDSSWHMRANVGGESVPLKVTPITEIGAGQNVLATFKDSDGVSWGATIDSNAMRQRPDLAEAISKASKNGAILNPLQAEALTGISNKHGLKVNPDNSFTPLMKDGTASSIRYKPNGRGGYIKVYDDSFLAGKMGFGTGSYNGKTAADYIAQGGVISDPVAAKAISGLDNNNGLYVYRAPDGRYRYRELSADGEYYGGPVDISRAPQILRKKDGQTFTESGQPVRYSVDEAFAMGASFENPLNIKSDEYFGRPKNADETFAKPEGTSETTNVDTEKAPGEGQNPHAADVYENIQGIQINENGTFSTIDNEGNVNSRQYLFGMDNPFGVKDEGDNNFAIYGGTFGDEEVEHIHVNDNGSVSYYDDDGNLGEEQFLTNVPGMEEVPVHEVESGVFEPDDEENTDNSYMFVDRTETTLSMENVEDDGEGGYTATMVATGIFVDQNSNAASENAPSGFDVHIKPMEAQESGERLVTSFEDPETSQPMGIYASEKDISSYLQKNAGRDIQSDTIGATLMGESAEKINDLADMAGIQASNVYHISADGTTVGCMTEDYAKGAIENAQTGSDYYTGGVFTKYDVKGNRLYTYADGPRMRSVETLHSKPSTFATGFSGLHLEDDERITDVRAFRPAAEGSPRNYRVTVSNRDDIFHGIDFDTTHDSCDGTYHSFFDARNIPEDYPLDKEKCTVLTDDNGYVLVEIPGKHLWTKDEKESHYSQSHNPDRKLFRDTNGKKKESKKKPKKPRSRRTSV